MVSAMGGSWDWQGTWGHRSSYFTSQSPQSANEQQLSSAALSMRRYRQRIKQNTQMHALYKQRQVAYQKRYMEKVKMKIRKFGESYESVHGMGLAHFYGESGALETSISKGLPPGYAQWHQTRLKKNTERSRRYRHFLKQQPDKYRRYREKQTQYNRQYRDRKKAELEAYRPTDF